MCVCVFVGVCVCASVSFRENRFGFRKRAESGFKSSVCVRRQASLCVCVCFNVKFGRSNDVKWKL